MSVLELEPICRYIREKGTKGTSLVLKATCRIANELQVRLNAFAPGRAMEPIDCSEIDMMADELEQALKKMLEKCQGTTKSGKEFMKGYDQIRDSTTHPSADHTAMEKTERGKEHIAFQ